MRKWIILAPSYIQNEDYRGGGYHTYIPTALVYALAERGAQNLYKKKMPNARFRGKFGYRVISLEDALRTPHITREIKTWGKLTLNNPFVIAK